MDDSRCCAEDIVRALYNRDYSAGDPSDCQQGMRLRYGRTHRCVRRGLYARITEGVTSDMGEVSPATFELRTRSCHVENMELL